MKLEIFFIFFYLGMTAILFNGCTQLHTMSVDTAIKRAEWALRVNEYKRDVREAKNGQGIRPVSNPVASTTPAIETFRIENSSQNGFDSHAAAAPSAEFKMLALPHNNDPVITPNGQIVRGYYYKGVAVCKKWDMRCWQHEYVHHLAAKMDKHDVEELLARLMVRYLESEERAKRVEFRAGFGRRAR